MNKKWVVATVLSTLVMGAQSWADTMSAPEGRDQAQQSATVEQQRQGLRDMAKATLDGIYQKHPAAKAAIAGAAGYAVFDNGSATVVFAGAGGGSGVAVNQSNGKETFMRMAQIKGGLGLGLKSTRLVLVFANKNAFQKFVNKGWAFGGEAGVAAKAGDVGGGFEGARVVGKGVYAYQFTENGVDAEVTVSGTKYFKDSKLNSSN